MQVLCMDQCCCLHCVAEAGECLRAVLHRSDCSDNQAFTLSAMPKSRWRQVCTMADSLPVKLMSQQAVPVEMSHLEPVAYGNVAVRGKRFL